VPCFSERGMEEKIEGKKLQMFSGIKFIFSSGVKVIKKNLKKNSRRSVRLGNYVIIPGVQGGSPDVER